MGSKTVLVTGGAGFIGKHTVKELEQNSYNVIVADLKEKPDDLNCKYYSLDVTSPEFKMVFVENSIDFIIHLAALPSVADSIKMPLLDCKNNYQATVSVCVLAQEFNIKKIVFSSTAAVYAHPKYLPVDENHPTAYLSPYAITKKASENFIEYCGIPYVIYRYANVYGSGQDCTGEAGVVAKFFDLMAHNQQIKIHGDGNQYRDFIYVDDIAKANVLALQNNVQNEIINVSTNTKTTINELFSIMKQALGYKLQPEHTVSRIGDIDKSILCNKKFISLFNYTPSIDIKTGINLLLNDILQKGIKSHV